MGARSFGHRAGRQLVKLATRGRYFRASEVRRRCAATTREGLGEDIADACRQSKSPIAMWCCVAYISLPESSLRAGAPWLTITSRRSQRFFVNLPTANLCEHIDAAPTFGRLHSDASSSQPASQPASQAGRQAVTRGRACCALKGPITP